MEVTHGNLQTLERTYSTAFREGYDQAPRDHESFAMTIPSGSLTQEYAWLGQFPSLNEWSGERIIRGINQQGFAIRNRLFESTVGVQRTTIEDDQYGVYGPLMREMGRAASDHQAQMVYGLLAQGFTRKGYDGQYFFDTDHPVSSSAGGTTKLYSNDGGGNNAEAWFLVDASRMVKPIIFQERLRPEFTMLNQADDEHVFMRDEYLYGIRERSNVGFGFWQTAYGSKDELNDTNYKTAREAMRGVKGDEGRPLGITPTHLIVPPTMEEKGRELLVSERSADGSTNVWFDTATLVVTPWLSAGTTLDEGGGLES
ncbi:MAG: Mu-like prophage major head subunit gpT family protein [Gammaproteobacteria bacterium]|nr:Mu-like prophage major head subunit gpT family protein [Gammaproteobacteria bacterium]